jgi:ABC-2 type transport system permease protein
MVIKYLIQKEFLQIRRNAFLPRLIFIFPIMIMCVMPWVMNMEVKNITVDVVDNDRSTMSSQLVHRIEASNYFIFKGQKGSYDQAMKDVESSQADAIVEIPPHFERDMKLGRNPQILVATNAVNGTKGNMGNAYLSSIISQHIMGAGKGMSASASLDGKAQEAVSILYLYNKNLNYKLFMIPSLLAILVMLMCGFLPALNIVGEKESGTIEAINVTPVGKADFILAKLIPYWVIALVVMTICLVLAWAVYGITSAGSLGLVYLLAMLLALVFSGFGLVISNYNDTMQQAVFVMWFFVVCLLLLSGLFTPVRSMPHWAYLTTYVNPMHYFIDAIRTVFVRGGTFACVQHQVLALAAIAVVMNVWAVLSYRKNS